MGLTEKRDHAFIFLARPSQQRKTPNVLRRQGDLKKRGVFCKNYKKSTCQKSRNMIEYFLSERETF
ncbi:hypothetical protein DKB62_04915 [Megasphaera stantonii]|uniref:Uncharacterized protein n=1 Tax=Megasphaera stantonii TaxID=2144175 RepID=A0A346AYL4_9FIRM|nr:hypothetical protein DKB62_04915 [Megasphaera stantonii]